MNGLEALDSVRCALSLCPNHNYKKENDLCNIIEKELKDYYEIKEIAKHYHFDDLAKDTHKTDTEEKYRLLFNGAICDIQADYRKARAFEIIKRGLALAKDKTKLAERCLNYDDTRVFHTPHIKKEIDLLEELLG